MMRAVLTVVCLASATASPLLYAAQQLEVDEFAAAATTPTEETFKSKWWGTQEITVYVDPRPAVKVGGASIWRADVAFLTPDRSGRLQDLHAEPFCVVEAPKNWQLKSSLFNHGGHADVDFDANDAASDQGRERTLHRTSALLASRGHAGAERFWFDGEATGDVENWLSFQHSRGTRLFDGAPAINRAAFNELRNAVAPALGEVHEMGEISLEGLRQLSAYRGWSAKTMLPAAHDGMEVRDVWVPEEWATRYLPPTNDPEEEPEPELDAERWAEALTLLPELSYFETFRSNPRTGHKEIMYQRNSAAQTQVGSFLDGPPQPEVLGTSGSLPPFLSPDFEALATEGAGYSKVRAAAEGSHDVVSLTEPLTRRAALAGVEVELRGRAASSLVEFGDPVTLHPMRVEGESGVDGGMRVGIDRQELVQIRGAGEAADPDNPPDLQPLLLAAVAGTETGTLELTAQSYQDGEAGAIEVWLELPRAATEAGTTGSYLRGLWDGAPKSEDGRAPAG